MYNVIGTVVLVLVFLMGGFIFYNLCKEAKEADKAIERLFEDMKVNDDSR